MDIDRIFDDMDSECATSGNVCTGINHCEGREFDEKKKDCQACLDEATKAVKDCKNWSIK
jgi:hypothetical protein